ncbi:1-acyl-sn-glycerol-3-phosphate acyltransferase gamma-like isoform X2 [Artemia franciscana]|uniref:Phospholipid/glycerol acyltransferase domain-containing protein n=1 Tax=Artemia franciscana TaxID=6661 RepID=A0AA88HTU8_ARTSF|nr:hypothetical protein QYM36_009865 [Artemia franciscana]
MKESSLGEEMIATRVLERLKLVLVLPMLISLIISGLFLNLCQFLLWSLLKPVNAWLYRKIDYYLIYSIWSQIVFVSHWWSNSQCYVWTEDETWKKMKEEHAIVIMNHSYEVDWLMGWTACEERSVLASAKGIIKKEIEKVPIIGWSWKFGESIFLHRNWEKDQENLRTSANIVSLSPDPVWLLLFPEGTRFSEEKHEKSLLYARKNNLPELQNLLLPRVKGFVAVARLLKGKFPAVYDSVMGFDLKNGAAPTLKNMLMGRRVVAEIFLKRIPLENLPDSEEDLTNWLYQCFKEKDERLGRYKETGSFCFEGETSPPKQSRDRRLAPLINIAVWNALILPPIFRAFLTMLFSGIASVVFSAVLVLIAILVLYKVVGLTKVQRSPTKKTN